MLTFKARIEEREGFQGSLEGRLIEAGSVTVAAGCLAARRLCLWRLDFFLSLIWFVFDSAELTAERMNRNQYDTDVSTWSPQGKLHQVEYAMESVKQGSCCLGIRSKDFVVLSALKK